MSVRLPLPSLATGAAVAVVSGLWCRHLENNNSNSSKLLTDVMELERDINNLPLPPEYKRQLLSFVRPFVQYLERWLEFWQISMRGKEESINQYLSKLNLRKNIRVTPLGSVDGRATAREILKSGSLTVEDAFRLACINCMEDDVRKIWPRVNSYFVNKVYKSGTDKEPSEVVIFTRYTNEGTIVGNIMEGIQSYTFRWCDTTEAWCEFGIRSAVNSGNEVAVDFFIRKFNPKRKRKLIQGIAESIFSRLCPRNASLVLLIISHMELEQWREFVRIHSHDVLLTFIKWPLQMFFFEIANESREYLTAKKLFHVLIVIAETVGVREDGPFRDHNMDQVGEIFVAFWKDTSYEQKVDVIRLMMDRDLIQTGPELFFILQESTVIEVLHEVFFQGEALLNFLSVGSRKNEDWLRTILYKYLPSCKGNEDVERMLSLYEEQILMNFDRLPVMTYAF